MTRRRSVEHHQVVFFSALLYNLGDALHQSGLLHTRRVFTQRHVLIDFAAQVHGHQSMQRVANLFHVQAHRFFGVQLQAV